MANRSKNRKLWWPVKVFFIALFLAFIFSFIAETTLTAAHIAVSFVVLALLILIKIFSDMIGVAVAAAEEEPFAAMASRKIRGAKKSLYLIGNAEKVANICCDIVGDICGILSGALGAAIMVAVAFSAENKFVAILPAVAMSSAIAAVTICGEAIAKRYAIDNANKIIERAGKFLSFFSRKDR